MRVLVCVSVSVCVLVCVSVSVLVCVCAHACVRVCVPAWNSLSPDTIFQCINYYYCLIKIPALFSLLCLDHAEEGFEKQNHHIILLGQWTRVV